MIARTMDPTQLNAVANHPDVRPWLGGEGPIDLSPVIRNPANIALCGSQGGFVGVCLEPTIYEVHTMFLLEAHGATARNAMEAGCQYVFAETDAISLVTKVPEPNRAARGLTLAAGFRCIFNRHAAWPDIGGPDHLDYFELTLVSWAMKSAVCLQAGTRFHVELARMLSPDWPEHPKDGDAHDRAAGAAYLMALAGNGLKAADTYNRWARLAGYPLVAVLSLHPLIMDVGAGVIVEYHQGAMRLVDCPKQEARCLSE